MTAPLYSLRYLQISVVALVTFRFFISQAIVVEHPCYAHTGHVAFCFAPSSSRVYCHAHKITRGTDQEPYLEHLPTQIYGKLPIIHGVRRSRSTLVAMDASDSEKSTSMRDIFSSPLNRRLLLGGWSAALGTTLVNMALSSRDAIRTSQTLRRELFKSITEDTKEYRNILEVGIGGNSNLGGFANLDFYRPGQRIVGIDPTLFEGESEELKKASKRAYKRGLEFEAMGGVAEELPFESGSFDSVVSTMVLCTVRDPDAALREVSRVLRPGGKFLFIEHVLAPDEGWLSLRQQQELFDPLEQILASGCHLTRETGRLVRDATSGPPSR